ncbi:MAG: hypothetical protein M0C28_19275 [Candidatus Moduliflexus flocculans]|nr:hypothetical protein [Candidatus Moduliflexus flocculans]
MATAGINLFNGASADYRQIYGQAVLMPELKVTARVYRDFTVWASCALIAKDGYIEEVDEATHIRQTLLGFGAGYAHDLSAKLRLRGELGMTYISFKENALAETAKGSGLGWKIGANLDYSICKKMFATLAAGYGNASDEADFGKIELGGFEPASASVLLLRAASRFIRSSSSKIRKGYPRSAPGRPARPEPAKCFRLLTNGPEYYMIKYLIYENISRRRGGILFWSKESLEINQ